mmetsp:Transcript_44088/g.106582  ORF Transcript_44088/g.106582 Transcript_44088/m.106582 type:complete len:80 (+) Transcript_44088:62-301(+)
MGFRRRELNKKVVQGEQPDQWSQFAGEDPEALRRRKGLPIKDRPLNKYADGVLLPITAIVLLTIVVTAALWRLMGLHLL